MSNGRAVGVSPAFFRRRKSCPFTGPNALVIDYDTKLLSRYISERADRAEPYYRGLDEEAA